MFCHKEARYSPGLVGEGKVALSRRQRPGTSAFKDG